ncbi:hypothetical protein BDV93DRAFT_525516 [Ceratobasidium sp. AG-I]|nr:hypothetical protein BDV93DRAFT_525516 [Ceratobasidium sp. AG-I]
MSTYVGAEFYQVVGYQGHFRSQYWYTNAPENNPHEYAEEAPAAQAIAGEGSPLYLTPGDSPPFVELVLGIRPHGAISLLIPSPLFTQYIMARRGYTSRKSRCPAPYPTSSYLSLSPIRFSNQAELENMLKLLRPVKPAKRGADDSKLNRQFAPGNPKPARAWFEQVRLLWYVLVNGRTDLLQWYGLPQLPSGVRMAYLAQTPWVDPNTFEIPPNEDDVTLDIGWYEPATSTSQHIMIEEHESFSKSSLAKATFEHGETSLTLESDLPNTLSSLLSAPPNSGPLVLVTHDWPRTSQLLRKYGIDTTAPNWHVGVGELLGFERPAGAAPNANGVGGGNGGGNNGHGDRRGGDNGERERERERERNRDNGYDHPRARPPPSDSKPNIKHEDEDEKSKMQGYGGRSDSSSSARRRSLSPRARTRTLGDADRKYQRPVFRPESPVGDEEEEEGEIRSPSRPTSQNSPTDEAPVKPDPDAPTTSNSANDTANSTNTNGPTTDPAVTIPSVPPEIYVVDLRMLITTLLDTTRPYILYPPLARRLGLPVDGWCAGNQAVQMHTALSSLVSGDPIHARKEQIEKEPALPAPARPLQSGNAPPPAREEPSEDEFEYDDDDY